MPKKCVCLFFLENLMWTASHTSFSYYCTDVNILFDFILIDCLNPSIIHEFIVPHQLLIFLQNHLIVRCAKKMHSSKIFRQNWQSVTKHFARISVSLNTVKQILNEVKPVIGVAMFDIR